MYNYEEECEEPKPLVEKGINVKIIRKKEFE
jgi:hypothetical protein